MPVSWTEHDYLISMILILCISAGFRVNWFFTGQFNTEDYSAFRNKVFLGVMKNVVKLEVNSVNEYLCGVMYLATL